MDTGGQYKSPILKWLSGYLLEYETRNTRASQDTTTSLFLLP